MAARSPLISRKDGWYFGLVNVLAVVTLSFAVVILDGITGQRVGSGGFDIAANTIAGIYFIAIFIPSLAVSVRRLHDGGRSGWLLLFNFIPFFGALALLVLYCLDGQRGDNRFGPDPKVVAEASPYGYAPIS